MKKPLMNVIFCAGLVACWMAVIAQTCSGGLVYLETFTESSYPVVFTNTTPDLGEVWERDGTGGIYGGGTNVNDEVVAGNLTPPAGSPALSSRGGRLNFIGDDSTRAFSRLPGAGLVPGDGSVGADGTTIYVSLLIDLCQGSDGTSAFTGLELRDGIAHATNTYRRIKVGWMDSAYGVTPDTGSGSAALVQDTVNFVVLKFNYVSGNDTVDVYINPTKSELLEGVYDGQLSGADFSFNAFSLASFNDAAPSGYVDEVRVGTTLESVTSIYFGTVFSFE